VVTGLVLTGLALLFQLPGSTAVIVGFGLALSSTAFGLHMLAERCELETSAGRTAFSILLLQDLAVVPLLMLVSLLAHDASLQEGIELAMLDTMLAIVTVTLVGRFLLTPVLYQVATSRNAEVFMAAAVLVVLSTAWLMEAVGLSMALGAFLAGIMLADSRYRHQVIADIRPFRGILLGLFFMAVGMSINFGLMRAQGLLIVALVLGLLSIKGVLIWGLCRLMGVTGDASIRVALLLSQSGEFGFVIFGLAVVTGVIAADLFQLLLLIIALTMAISPLIVYGYERFSRGLKSAQSPCEVSAVVLDSQKRHVIIAGFGRVGRRVATILRAGDVPYVALDHDPDRVHQASAEGFQVFYGDASRADVLLAAGADHASVLVITLDKTEPARRLVHIMRHHYPDTPIYARARDRQHTEQLREAGATSAISETLEASLQLGGVVLHASGLVDEDVDRLLQEFRRQYYGEQNGHPQAAASRNRK
jgi:Kef-type K+ transport system membrane component KefB